MADYVQLLDGVYRTADTRVPLSALVSLFREGDSPEAIQRSFRTLTLEEVYGAITYYLANQEEIDQALSQELRSAEESWRGWRARHPELLKPPREAVSESSLSD